MSNLYDAAAAYVVLRLIETAIAFVLGLLAWLLFVWLLKKKL